MKKNYQFKKLLLISGSILLLFTAACKRDPKNNKTTTATPKKIGFYEVKDSIYKILLMNISKVGTQTTDLDLIFDTGSGGMVLDASEILPASAVTSTGFSFTGDSTVVDGITITNQTDIIEYGDDNATTSKVYGNLAYAPVTIGDANGNITVKRLPFFIYWKATDSKGNLDKTAGDFDVFGVSSEYDITFANNAFITSPLSYYDPGTGLTKGFKMDALGTTNFSNQGTYVPAITLGLTAADLTTGGYSLTLLKFYTGEGYLPIFPAKIGYSGNAFFNGYVLFDTGTEPYSYLQDPTAAATPVQLASGKTVTINISGSTSFSYSYTTADLDNLTYVENPANSGSTVSVVSLSFFENNAYLLDFQNNQLGLKND
ncbi:MAG: hypothetical protein ACHQHN_16695 [Sphingobacteriales bacterium]